MDLGDGIGPYRVLAKIGEGGMGQVYRATDTSLKRTVAIKVLPEAVAKDSERLARFQREAELLAKLNHPNIAQIHGLEKSDGRTALVMELVEGPTLADRIAQGPIPIDEALPIATQIADALEAAHEQGIIHRDLKPANVKVRDDGVVKVLDFGLAKAMEPTAAMSPGVSQSPTITTPAQTLQGMILGTAAYMAPEQARGKVVDKRADVWAFGCVFYEMLTGRRAFSGDDVSDVIASILAREPDWSAVPSATSPSIRRLLRRCLAKDRTERLRDIGDARIEIREARANIDTQEPSAIVRERGRRRARQVAFPVIVLMAVIAAVTAALRVRSTPAAPDEVRLDINAPPTNVPESLAIAPDGRSLVFVASTPEGQSRLWLRPLDSGTAGQLPGTDGARHPFWSPDSRSIGFFSDNKLRRVDLDGGSVRTLGHVHRGTNGTWNRDGVILFSSLGDPISRISETGGDLAELSGLFQEGSNFAPTFLPDGRRFLYYVRGTAAARGVYVGQLDGSLPPRRLLDSDAGAVYAPSGHLLFVQQGTLFAQAFDLTRLTLTGDPFPVTERAARCACLGLSVSDTGVIAFRATARGGPRQFVWFDRSGKETGRVSETGIMSMPSLSRDGQRVVGYRGNPVDGNIDVWVLDTRRAGFSRVTSDAGDDVAPAWSPDGDLVVFSSNRSGVHNMYRKQASSGGSEELLLSSLQEKSVSDWSADGRFVLFDSRDPNRQGDIWALPMDGSGKPFAVASQNDFAEQRGQFSPDGNWVAYQSDESGRHEIYVQRFPGPGNKWPISTNGGTQVRWRPDGKELFYVTLSGRLMSVSITLTSTEEAPEVGTPVELFAPPLGGMVQQADFRHQYMVSPDGERFLIATIGEGATSPITVILNWKPMRSP